jgi:hypothetical protein
MAVSIYRKGAKMGMILMVDGDGRLAEVGSTSFKILGCRDLGRSPLFDNWLRSRGSGTASRRDL